MALLNLVRNNYGGESPVSIRYENLHSFKEGVILLCQSILEIRRISHLHGSALFTIPLNSGNVFKAINTWAVSVVRYSAAFLGWSRLQLEEIDKRTRKLLTMQIGFHPKSNVDRLYISRSEGGRGLIGVQDTVETAILGLRNDVRNSRERLLIAAHTIERGEDRETPNEYKKRKKNVRKTP